MDNRFVALAKKYMHMENKHMKRCLTSFFIRELQIKVTMRERYTYSIRMAKIFRKINLNTQYQVLIRIWSNGDSHSLMMWMQDVTATLRDSVTISYETNHTLPM